MFPGQRTSRKNQELESLALESYDDEGFDDFGVPNRLATATPKSKSGRLLGRFRKQGQSTSALASAGHMDGDSDDDEVYIQPGITPTNLNGPGPNGQQPLQQLPQQPYQHPQQQYSQPRISQQGSHPQQGAYPQQEQYPTSQYSGGQPGYNAQGFHPAPPDISRPASEAASASPRSSGQGDISMSQISSLRDRQRYPGFDEDAQGRAMSLSSMSQYDTTPIIPMLGPVTNFQSGSTHNRATPQEKYRQRMIESRRALLSGETAIPLSGNPLVKPAAQSDSYLNHLAGVPTMGGTNGSRTMSLGNPVNQGGHPGGPPGARSMTMMSGPPTQMRGPPVPGQLPQGVPMYHNGPYGPNYPPGANPPQGFYGHSDAAMSYTGYPGSSGGPGNPQGNYFPHPQQHPMAPRPGIGSHGPQASQGSQASIQGLGLHPHNNNVYPRSAQGVPPQGRNTRAPEDSTDAFDFGTEESNTSQPFSPEGSETQASSNAGSHFANQKQEVVVDTKQIDELNSKLLEREDEIRMLSIELAESARRELQLPAAHSNDTQAHAADLAKAYDELSLERARRAAVESTATNPDISVSEKLAEMEHRHAEAVHLLAIRTEQYETLQRKHASLDSDYKSRLQEYETLATKLKEAEVAQRTQQQDLHLGQQVKTLETENAKLRQQVDEVAPQGRFSERVVDLEEQRKALQETLRAMRDRKDSEINALRSRVEQLQLQVQQQQQQRGGRIGSAGSGSAPNSAGSNSETGGLFRPVARGVLRQSSSESIPGADNNMPLSVPRLRDIGPPRPATPLHLRINYETKHEAV